MTLKELVISAKEYLTPKATEITGSSLYDMAVNIYSLRIVKIPLIISIVFVFIYFIFAGLITGSKKKNINRVNFWVFMTGLLLMVGIFFLYMLILWLMGGK